MMETNDRKLKKKTDLEKKKEDTVVGSRRETKLLKIRIKNVR